jgi:hypothetical protein
VRRELRVRAKRNPFASLRLLSDTAAFDACDTLAFLSFGKSGKPVRRADVPSRSCGLLSFRLLAFSFGLGQQGQRSPMLRQ